MRDYRLRNDADACLFLLLIDRAIVMDLRQFVTACSQTCRVHCADQLHLQHAKQ